VTGSPFGISGRAGPATLGVGPTGVNAGVTARGLTGNATVDAAIDQAISTGKGLAGIPTAISPALISALTHAPAMVGAVAGAMSLAGIPFSLIALAHTIASMSPTSVFSLQAALADPNPESQITAQQALAITLGGQMGPTIGGAQAPSGVPGQYGGFNLSPNFYAGFPQAVPTVPTGREDAPPDAPTGLGIGEGVPGISEAGPAPTGSVADSSTGTTGAGVSDF
jgi:hypothetical protein